MNVLIYTVNKNNPFVHSFKLIFKKKKIANAYFDLVKF